MTYPIRTILAAVLVFGLAGTVYAQEATTTTETAAATTTAPGTTSTAAPVSAAPAEAGAETEAGTETRREKSSYEIRNEFSNLVRRSPSELGQLLFLDPSLMTNEPFMAGYPAVAGYLRDHPEVIRNPRFYLAEFTPRKPETTVDEVFESFSVMAVFALVTFALLWLIRTTIEQKRWNRLSKQQSEVHNKILDRFGTSSELLEYVKSPAGSRFLESAPIPLHAEQPVTAPNRAMARAVWSVQIGVIVGAAALGMLMVSLRFDEETANGFFAMGAILLAIGVGFIGSAAVSLLVSRRLGLWDAPQGPGDPGARAIDAGSVR